MLRCALAVVVLAVALPVRAQPLVEHSSQVRFERSVPIDGKPFLCLGTGVRKKMVFDVYAVAWCADEAALRAEIARYFAQEGKRHAGLLDKSLAPALLSDPSFFRALLDPRLDSLVEMVFLRDVGRSAIRKGFTESLVKVLGEEQRARIDGFVVQLDRDIKKGDRLRMRVQPGGDISVSLETRQRTLHDEVLARVLWIPYLGEDGITPTLRKSVAEGAAAIQHCPDCGVTLPSTAALHR